MLQSRVDSVAPGPGPDSPQQRPDPPVVEGAVQEEVGDPDRPRVAHLHHQVEGQASGGVGEVEDWHSGLD